MTQPAHHAAKRYIYRWGGGTADGDSRTSNLDRGPEASTHGDRRPTANSDNPSSAHRDRLPSGIPSSRFTIVSYGEERPFAYGHDESAWSQNRRAVTVITGGAKTS